MKKPENLKYVDIERALKLIEGYEQIYLKVIDSFLENQQNLCEEIEANLGNNQEEARRLVHSCKGMSPNIGANTLYENALHLEKAILENNEEEINRLFTEFKSIFTEVYSELIKIKQANE